MNSDLILRIIITGLDILQAATDPRTRAAYSEYRQTVQKFIDENRNPTEEEWQELFSITEQLHHDLQSIEV